MSSKAETKLTVQLKVNRKARAKSNSDISSAKRWEYGYRSDLIKALIRDRIAHISHLHILQSFVLELAIIGTLLRTSRVSKHDRDRPSESSIRILWTCVST